MIELWVKRLGDMLQPASSADLEKLRDLPDGVSIKIRAATDSRSSRHHRLFFAAIAKAFFNWPESHEFQPKDDEHLRAWLLCKARYCTIETHELQDASMAEIVSDIVGQSLNDTKPHGFAVYNNNLVYVLKPKSIAWEKLQQKEFNKISQDISDILKAEINMSLDDFKGEEAA